jgi:hypothetical protein
LLRGDRRLILAMAISVLIIELIAWRLRKNGASRELL